MTSEPAADAPLRTNRDLYLFTAELIERRREDRLTLEAYLRRLHALALEHRAAEGLAVDRFARLLAAAFDPGDSDAGARPAAASPGFVEWERIILQQIQDLVDMEAAGTLRDEMRYFGVNAPRGSRWYNFDPCTFLECAMAGTFGGWEEGDSTSRIHVPGPVAVMMPDGTIGSADPRDLDDPVRQLDVITWEEFVSFLYSGQAYE